jgi:hypothetical protein
MVYTTELRGLQLLTAYLERPELPSEFLEFVTLSTSHQRVVINPDGLKINDEPAVVSLETVRLLRFLVRHPRSTWAHIKSAIYSCTREDDLLLYPRGCCAKWISSGHSSLRFDRREDRIRWLESNVQRGVVRVDARS